MDASQSNETVAEWTHQQQLPYHLASPRDVQTQSALEPYAWPTQAHVEPVASVAVPPPIAVAGQPNNGENLLLMCAVEEQTQLQFEDVELEHRADETSETLDVNVVRGSVEESRMAIYGARFNEEGEVEEVRAWIARSYVLFVEQISFQIRRTHKDSPYEAITGGPGRVYEPSDTEKCCDFLCQAYTCNNLFGLAMRDGSGPPTISKIESFATENLRKARALGIKAMTQVLWTPYTKALVGAYFRDFFVYAFFLLSFAMWISTLVGFVISREYDNDKDDTYILVKFIFSSVGLAFGTVDLVHHTYTHKFTTCEECAHCVSEVHQRYRPDVGVGKECCTCCNKAQKCCDSCTATYRCYKLPKWCATVLDAARLLLLEVMVYPNLLLSIFHFIIQVIEEDGEVEATTYISLILGTLETVAIVYFGRWVVLAGTIYSIQKIRTDNEKITMSSLVNTSSTRFHLTFVLNAIGHTIIQILMIIAIGARFYSEYTNFYDEDYHPSSKLWFMMLFGYVCPFVGVIMFLVTCHFWTQQFPIEFFLDYLKILQKPKMMHVFKSLLGKAAQKHYDTLQKLDLYLDQNTLLQEFNNVKHKDLTAKLIYPFFSPVHVILCLVYCSFLLAFGLCAVVDGVISPGWVFFYILGTSFAVIVNGYACAIMFLWVSIFAAVLAAVVFIVALIACLCIISGPGRRD